MNRTQWQRDVAQKDTFAPTARILCPKAPIDTKPFILRSYKDLIKLCYMKSALNLNNALTYAHVYMYS